jgi:hypothetical protein
MQLCWQLGRLGVELPVSRCLPETSTTSLTTATLHHPTLEDYETTFVSGLEDFQVVQKEMAHFVEDVPARLAPEEKPTGKLASVEVVRSQRHGKFDVVDAKLFSAQKSMLDPTFQPV